LPSYVVAVGFASATRLDRRGRFGKPRAPGFCVDWVDVDVSVGYSSCVIYGRAVGHTNSNREVDRLIQEKRQATQCPVNQWNDTDQDLQRRCHKKQIEQVSAASAWSVFWRWDRSSVLSRLALIRINCQRNEYDEYRQSAEQCEPKIRAYRAVSQQLPHRHYDAG